MFRAGGTVLYWHGMNSIEKFVSDIGRIRKIDRAENGGRYDGVRACKKIAELFERNNRNVPGVARLLSGYWLGTFVLPSPVPADEPSAENVARIRAFQAFLDNDEAEDFSVLTRDDWETLRDFVDGEAETLDIGLLQNLMGMVLSHGAL